jgi:hypothetical protein
MVEKSASVPLTTTYNLCSDYVRVLSRTRTVKKTPRPENTVLLGQKAA